MWPRFIQQESEIIDFQTDGLITENKVFIVPKTGSMDISYIQRI